MAKDGGVEHPAVQKLVIAVQVLCQSIVGVVSSRICVVLIHIKTTKALHNPSCTRVIKPNRHRVTRSQRPPQSLVPDPGPTYDVVCPFIGFE